MKQTFLTEYPFRECPRYDSCSCNKCPLDPLIDQRRVLPDDEKCKAWKSTRMKIAAKYPKLLPYGGLYKKQWEAKKRWADMDPAKKELILGRLIPIKHSPQAQIEETKLVV